MRRCFLLFVFSFGLFACTANVKEARRIYESGVAQWNGQGMLPDKLAAVQAFQRSAEMGYVPAQVALGFAYIKGEGVQANEHEALRWFQAAAEAGDKDAQYNTGLLFAKGSGGITKDYQKAIEWFTRAALQGDTGAQYNLAVMYANGEGSTADAISAYAWFSVAAQLGDETSAKDRDKLKEQLTTEQLNKAIRQSSRLRRQISSGLKHVSSSNGIE